MNPWDAKLYQDKHSFVWKHGEAVLDLLDPKPGEAILDLGCGTGHLTARIAAAGAAVVGIDSSPAMVEEARRGFPGLGFEIGDARRLNYADRFDGVFSNAVLHWIKEPDLVIAGVAQALKRGGRFVAEFGGQGNVQAILTAVQHAVQAVGGGRVDSPWYFPSVGAYAPLLEKAGLEVAFAALFDRPTLLEGPAGMRNWIEMFGGHFLSRVPPERLEEFHRRVEAELRPILFRDGSWFADYRRLRVVARRVEPRE